MIHKQTLTIPAQTCFFLLKACDQNRASLDIGKDEKIFDESVTFDDGKIMDIQVIAPIENESCWTQGVLYEKEVEGSFLIEVACTDVGESILGEFHVLHEGNEYICEVKMK